MKKAFFKWKPLSRKQKKILCWWQEGSKYKDYDGIIADGAVRSGKTVAMGFSFVIWAMTNYDRQNFGMAGKTIESFRRNVLGTLKSQLRSRGYTVKERKSENLVTISKGDKVNLFYLFGGKDESSQDLIQGITLAGMLFDEVALMPESFVNQATARCSVEGSKWWFNCNPQGPLHWFYVKWILKCRKKKLLYLHFTMADNLSLSKKIVDRYKNQYEGVFYNRYILGLWAIAEGIIYSMFNKEKHVIDHLPELEGDWYVSSDFGIQNATVFLLWRKQKKKNVWICCDEYYHSGRDTAKQKTVDQLADGLVDMLGDRIPRQIIVDPSAAALIVELRKRGYKVKKADNDVLNGITEVGKMITQERIKFLESCKKTIEEFGIYSWDSKASQRGEDKPIKEHDHCMDAVRYFVKTKKLASKEDDGNEEYLMYM